MSKVEQRGKYAVLRDSNGKLRTKVAGDITKTRTTWRAFVRKLTNNGEDQFEVLIKLSKGEPIQYKHPTTGEIAVAVPGVEVMRQAAKDVIEFLHGKAVAQTEVSKAEEEAVHQEKLRALSDQQLLELARPILEATLVTEDDQDNAQSKEREPAGP